MNEKILKSHAMCEAARIQVVTQVFAELWKDNHHAYFQLINKKSTENRYQFHHHCSFFFSACMQKNSNAIIPYGVFLDVQLFPLVYSWAYNYSWIFPDLFGRTIIPAKLRGSGRRKSSNFWFCGFGFVGLFSSF